jgi:hypothetical protein
MSILRRLEKVLDERLRGIFASPQEGSREAIELYREALNQVTARATVGARGDRVLPFDRVRIELRAESPDRRAILEALFEPVQMLEDVRAGLLEERVSAPPGLSITVDYPADAATELRVFCERAAAAPKPVVAAMTPVKLVVLEGAAESPEIALQASTVNVGRTRDVVDSSGRPFRRNQLFFPDALNDEVNSTVSRSHAHLKLNAADGEWRIFDDGSSMGTAVFRDGVRIDVPAHASRGVGLRVGDEIFFGSVRVRLENAD